jgi:3-dehydroquinate synthase
MKRVNVELGKRSYNVCIAKGIISDAGRIVRGVSRCRACFVLTNKKIVSLYGSVLRKSLNKAGFDVLFHTVIDSESAKSHAKWFRVVKALASFDKRRGACLVALGGGVIGDLGGFTASTYRRGIDFIQVPTTLLAQVDAAIGGKTAIDMDFAKNLVGTFYQPKVVLSDISVLRTLPPRQVRNGLSEIIKYAVIFDKTFFSFLEKNMKKILNLDYRCLEYIIARCSKLKAEVVSVDEKEKTGYRSILNFGHTIGHAIESASSYTNSINHGEAVSIGMLAAFDMSVSIGMTDNASADRLKNILKITGLPAKIKGIDPSRILSATLYDKKTVNGKRRWILPKSIGHVAVCSDVPEDIIKKAVYKIAQV